MSDTELWRPVHIARLETAGNLFLAPVAGYTDRAFRSLCVDEGASLSCTELVSAEALIRQSPKTWPLLTRADNERHYAIQLFGSQPEQLYRAALLLSPWKPSVLDLNCGCPVPKVIKTGSGSALMREPAKLAQIVEAMVRASREALGDIPVTVKIRLGWDSGSINYREVARCAVEAGAALVALHARTRAQGYSGTADHSYTADLVSRLGVPVVASGDVFSPESARDILRDTGCAAVMFARGAMGNPFIFRETRDFLQTGSYQSVPHAVRLEKGLHQLELLSADIGEDAACREMRKHFCAYTKGMNGGAALRNELVHALAIEEYRRIVGAALS